MKHYSLLLLFLSQTILAQYVVDWSQFYTEPIIDENQLLATFNTTDTTIFIFTDTTNNLHIYEQSDNSIGYEYTFLDVQGYTNASGVGEIIQGDGGYYLSISVLDSIYYYDGIIRLNNDFEYEWQIVIPDEYLYATSSFMYFKKDTLIFIHNGKVNVFSEEKNYEILAINLDGEIISEYEFEMIDDYYISNIISAGDNMQLLIAGPDLNIKEFDYQLNLWRDTTFIIPESGFYSIIGPMYYEDRVIFTDNGGNRFLYSYKPLALDHFEYTEIAEVPWPYYTIKATYLDSVAGLIYDLQGEWFNTGDETLTRRTFNTSFEQLDEYTVLLNEIIEYELEEVFVFDTATLDWVGYTNNLNGNWPWPDTAAAVMVFQANGTFRVDSIDAGYEGANGRLQFIFKGSYGLLYNERLDLLPPDGSNIEIVRIKNLALPIITIPEETLSVYPNPFQTSFSISLPESGIFQATLMNMDGSVIHSSMTYMEANNPHNFSYKDIPEGVYLFRLTGNGKCYTASLLKK